MTVFSSKLQLVKLVWMNGYFKKQVHKEQTLKEIIDDIRQGTYKKNIEDFRLAKSTESALAEAEGREPNKTRKEQYVPSFMPHGYIKDKNVKLRDNNDVFDHTRWNPTGYVHMDLDNIPLGDFKRVKEAIIKTNPVAVFQSPSGDGLKVFYVHNMPELTLQQKADFTKAVRFFVRSTLESLDLGNYYDPAACDPNRQCYFSYDENAFYQDEVASTTVNLLEAYNDLAGCRFKMEQLQNDIKRLCTIVKNDINDSVIAERSAEVQRRLHKHQMNSNTGEMSSFALACFMVESGVPYAEMLVHLEQLRMSCSGTWKPHVKIANAEKAKGTARNRYASETIEIDSGIDTVRYNALREEIDALEKYITAGKKTVKRKYSDLALGIIGTAERTPNLMRLEHEFTEQAKRIYSALERSRLVTVVENAGSGKSRTMGELARMIDEDIRGHDSVWRGMLFCTNTRANRDSFAKANPKFVVWKGTSEIVFEVTQSKAAMMKCSEYYADETFEGSVVKQLLTDGIITDAQYSDIQVKLHDNRAKMKSKFVTCCHAKVQVGEAIKKFVGHVIVFDEMAADDVQYIDSTESAFSFGGAVECKAQDQEAEEVIQKFMQVVAAREGGVVMLSAEKSLLRAFGHKNTPNLKMKRLFPEIIHSMEHLGAPKVLEDDHLSVVIVKSLANAQGADARVTIAQMLRKHGYLIISDGKDDQGVAIGDMTIEGCKGSNDMMTKKTAVLLGSPCPEAIGEMMMRLSCDEETAISVIISDQANQAIGRNVGYRNRGAECLLVVAANNLRNGKTLELDILTPHVFDIASKDKLDDAPLSIQMVFGPMVQNSLYKACRVADKVTQEISTKGHVLHSEVQKLVKSELITMGTSAHDVKNGGIVTAIYGLLKYRGFESKRKSYKNKQGTWWYLGTHQEQ